MWAGCRDPARLTAFVLTCVFTLRICKGVVITQLVKVQYRQQLRFCRAAKSKPGGGTFCDHPLDFSLHHPITIRVDDIWNQSKPFIAQRKMVQLNGTAF